MPNRRHQLQTLLESIVGSGNVYFQPPESVKLSYPCIIYSRSDGNTEFANDKPYTRRTEYDVMVIDKDPDSLIPEKISELPMCVFKQHYTKDNLNHDIYTLFY
jgi:hypothetical protein